LVKFLETFNSRARNRKNVLQLRPIRGDCIESTIFLAKKGVKDYPRSNGGRIESKAVFLEEKDSATKETNLKKKK